MWKKYKTEKEGNMLRIIALKDFYNVKKGDKGGLIEKETNLSQEGNCWVYYGAMVFEDAVISDNVRVYKDAKVYGKARVYEDAGVYNNAQIYGEARVHGMARISEFAQVYGNTEVYEYANIFGEAKICKNAKICGIVQIYRNAEVSGNVKLWSTRVSNITTSVENNKDYIMFGDKDRKGFRIFSSNMKVKNEDNNIITTTAINYLKNIKTIRQIYEKEI